MTEGPAPQSNEKLSYDADYWRGLYLTAIEIGNEIRAERDKLQAENQQLRDDKAHLYGSTLELRDRRDAITDELVVKVRRYYGDMVKRNSTVTEPTVPLDALLWRLEQIALAAAVVGEPGKAGSE